MPESERSAPLTMVSGGPDAARNTPESLHPEASMREALLDNCGDSTLAVRLKMCFRQLSQLPLSSSKTACASASDGGLINDTGFWYPVATLRGDCPWLIRPTQRE